MSSEASSAVPSSSTPATSPAPDTTAPADSVDPTDTSVTPPLDPTPSTDTTPATAGTAPVTNAPLPPRTGDPVTVTGYRIGESYRPDDPLHRLYWFSASGQIILELVPDWIAIGDDHGVIGYLPKAAYLDPTATQFIYDETGTRVIGCGQGGPDGSVTGVGDEAIWRCRG